MSESLQKTHWPAVVFYDGACPLCAREIRHYQGLRHEGRLKFVDISRPGFRPEAYGRTMQEFMARMQVRDASGLFCDGVDGFRVIWAALPGRHYRMLRSFVSLPVVRSLAEQAYRIFAANRHRLRAGKVCDSDSCSVD